MFRLKTISAIWNAKDILVLPPHVDKMGGCWPDGRHWLATIYTRSKTYHYWTGRHRFKPGRTVYYPSGCRGISLTEHVSVLSAQAQGAILNKSIVVSGVLEGLSLMGKSGSEYHRKIRSVPPVPSIESDPWVIDIVKIRPAGTVLCEWEVERTIDNHVIEDPKLNGLKFSFEIKTYWNPDPIALKQYYIEEQRRARFKGTALKLGKAVQTALRNIKVG